MAGADRHVVILGAGVTGLVTAWRLVSDADLGAETPTHPAAPSLPLHFRPGLRVTIVDSAPRVGGNVRTQEEDGFLVEWGPNGFLDNAPETPRLVRALNLTGRLLPASDAAATRFIYTRGKLRPVPLKPPAFILSDILTLRGKLRVLQEPFVPARSNPEESVYDFAARRIGHEAARVLVDAMVAGVYAGDGEQLELLSCFPKMVQLERDHGGLVKGMLALARARRGRRNGGPAGPGGVLTSFDRGMSVLTDALHRAVIDTGRVVFRTGSAPSSLTPPGDPGEQWRMRIAGGEELLADAVLLAASAGAAADLVESFDPGLAAPLREIPGAPLFVVALAYRNEDLPAPLDGFGFLVPRGEGPRCLGVLWDSSVYNGRAPAGHSLLRAMIGGARDPRAIEMSDEDALATVRVDLERTMGLRAEPARTWVIRQPLGIPQYTLGHAARLARIEGARGRWPGLFLSGNAYRGVSVNHCVEQSIPVAREIAVSMTR